MSRLRQRATWIICGWLCCQLSVLTTVPLSLAAGLSHAADSISCTCVHGANAQCPMHHPANPAPNCHCRNAADPDAAAIVSLLGTIAETKHIGDRKKTGRMNNTSPRPLHGPRNPIS